MISTRKLASALCLAGCFSALPSKAQTVGVVPLPGDVATTTNLVNSTPTATTTTTTWQNVGSWNQGLPCWSPQDAAYGAYCGPQPYFNQGAFNFSYGVTDVYQTVNLAAALPNSGTGLRITGYNFGFLAKNGNGWDGAGLDTLWAYVRFADAGGKTVENYNYNLNYQFDWTQFNFSKNFTNPYPTAQLSTATLGFVGGDTSNYWAGPYGPEVYNISFNLKYDVDPCSYNPLYSPTCPGFSDAMKKITDTPLASEPITVIAPTATAPSTTTAPTTITSAPVAESQPTVTASVITAAPTTTASQTRSVTPLSTSSILANIRSIEQQLQATVNNTVQTSIQSSIEIGQAQAQQDASRGQQAGVESAQSQTQLQPQSQSINGSTGAGTTGTTGSGLTVGSAPFTLGFSVPGTTSLSASLLSPKTLESTTVSNDSTMQESPLVAAARPGDPTQAARTGNREIAPAEPVQESGPTVRNTAPPAQLAGGADFTAMSRATDITSYSSMRLTDAVFYQPREIYRGQRVVDNAKVLRGLGSDRLHQQMVEQQYQQGN